MQPQDTITLDELVETEVRLKQAVTTMSWLQVLLLIEGGFVIVRDDAHQGHTRVLLGMEKEKGKAHTPISAHQ